MSVRVRFAPSPTGTLHIGGVRTALYNYLFARKHHGSFILRIEDTDQNRLVEGAEQYIMDSLEWVGLLPDESPGNPGDYGPYRQSERLDIYRDYARQLVDSGKAYYAFDTQEALEEARKSAEAAGGAFLYSAANRHTMRNSLSMPESEVQRAIDAGEPYVIRLKVEPDEEIVFFDLIREEVRFSSNGLDDKVLMKADGFPTYHLANVVDDYLMKITHVIRGEEWLSSTAHHILLYRAFGWEADMPAFSHLPLILKPSGNGKLSKRDGDKLGIPVFPLSWDHPGLGQFYGFREAGFLPDAVINFLALLGWSPGDDIELMDIGEMIDLFSIEKIGKSGSRFDIEKARWFNHQYIMAYLPERLAYLVGSQFIEAGYEFDERKLEKIILLLQERVTDLNDFLPSSRYFFEEIKNYESDGVIKKWNEVTASVYMDIVQALEAFGPYDALSLEEEVRSVITQRGVGLGTIFPALRVALTGMAKGPDLFMIMEILGKEAVVDRLHKGYTLFNTKN